VPTRGGPPAWGLGVGLTTLHRKNKPVTKILKKPRTWTDSLDKRPKQKKWSCDLIRGMSEVCIGQVRSGK
jgi:hypothetical protein